ncbi:MAG: YraN family protein [Ignavibacteriales bacterium]
MTARSTRCAGRLETGRAGEDIAVAELERRGYRIIERNWRCQLGEIDVVADHHGVLVFVEVKSRRSTSFGAAAEAVDARKVRRLARLARAYMSARPALLKDRQCRFDVVAVTMYRDETPSIEVVQDAFST